VKSAHVASKAYERIPNWRSQPRLLACPALKNNDRRFEATAVVIGADG